MCKGSGKPIIGDIALKKGVLHVESDIVVQVGPVEDSGKGILSHYLIAHGVWGSA